MKEYTILSNRKRNYTILQGQEVVGKMHYPSALSQKSEAEFSSGKKLKLDSAGFWSSRLDVLDNDKLLLSFSMGWNGSFTVMAGTQKYLLRPVSFFRGTFSLRKEGSDEVLAELFTKFKWKKFRYDFQINAYPEFQLLDDPDAMLVTLISAVNYYITVAATAGT